MTALLALLLATVGTYLIRVGSVRAFGGRAMHPAAARMLHHAALGVMASLVVSSLPDSPGAALGVGPAGALGIATAVVAARLSSNMTIVMVVGVSAYAASTAFLG